MGILDFFSHEAGQQRRKALDETLGNLLDINRYIPPNSRDRAASMGNLLAMLNPVNDMEQASVSGRQMMAPNQNALSRFGHGLDMATNSLAVAAPVAGFKYADDAVDAGRMMVDAFTGVDAMGRQAAGNALDAGRRFAADESGAMRLWHGSPHNFDDFKSDKIGTGSSDALDGWGINLTDDPGEAAGYMRPDLRNNPFAQPENQVFSGDGYLYEVGVSADVEDFLPTREKIANLPDDVQRVVSKYYRHSDEFADQRNLGFYLNKNQNKDLQDEIESLGYKGFKADRGHSTNFIVFDDKAASVLSKDGVKTPAGHAQGVLDMLKSGNGDKVTDEMLDMGDPVANAKLNQYLFDNYDLPMDEASRMARAEAGGSWDDAYHATGRDFNEFNPSNFRGASFFGPTPEGAEKGARASANEGVGSGNGLIIPARVNTSGVEGLGAYARKDMNDFHRALDNRIYSEAEVDALMSSDAAPLRGDWTYFFDDVTDYDALRKHMDSNPGKPPPDGIIGYKPARPLHYSGDLRRDNTGRQFAHYSEGMSEKPISDYVKSQGNTGFTMQDESGLALAVTDPSTIRSRFARFDPRLSHLRNLSASAAGVGLLPYLLGDEE